MRKKLMIASYMAFVGLAAGPFGPPLAFASDQLTVTSMGGVYQASLRKAVLEPFSKATGIKITDVEYSLQAAKIRAMVQTNTVSWDAVDTDMGTVLQLCAEGQIEKIDWKQLGLDRTKFMGAGDQDCGLPYVTSATVIAYDKDKLPNKPKTIADFFDTQKFPGKRGLRKRPDKLLEWSLMADGVPVNEVYKVLSTAEGVDRAFKKLDTIKKDIVWWESNGQPVQLLADGQVVMTSVVNGRIYDANKNSDKHFEILWDTQQWEVALWVIPHGSPHLDAAHKFLAFAGSPQPQANLTQYLPYGPTNKDAMALADPAMLPYLPTTPAHMQNALERDGAFWRDKYDELNQRLTVWLAK